jgi:hypothetical protein
MKYNFDRDDDSLRPLQDREWYVMAYLRSTFHKKVTHCVKIVMRWITSKTL